MKVKVSRTTDYLTKEGVVSIPEGSVVSIDLKTHNFEMLRITYNGTSGLVKKIITTDPEVDCLGDTDEILRFFEQIKNPGKIVFYASRKDQGIELPGFLVFGEVYERLGYRNKRIRSILWPVIMEMCREESWDLHYLKYNIWDHRWKHILNGCQKPNDYPSLMTAVAQILY